MPVLEWFVIVRNNFNIMKQFQRIFLCAHGCARIVKHDNNQSGRQFPDVCNLSFWLNKILDRTGFGPTVKTTKTISDHPAQSGLLPYKVRQVAHKSFFIWLLENREREREAELDADFCPLHLGGSTALCRTVLGLTRLAVITGPLCAVPFCAFQSTSLDCSHPESQSD